MQFLHWRSCLVILGLGLAQVPFVLAQALVGGVFAHVVRPGESLTLIGARHGLDPRPLARENDLDWQALLRPGQRLKVDNRHLVPQPRTNGIVINIPQRLLFLFREGRVVAHYPVGLGRPDWPTPVGRFRVREKAVDKSWIVPPSIQAEMAAKGQVVRERVPPGPDNPLGRHWMGLAPGNWVSTRPLPRPVSTTSRAMAASAGIRTTPPISSSASPWACRLRFSTSRCCLPGPRTARSVSKSIGTQIIAVWTMRVN